MAKINEKIKCYRKANNLTQEDLASRLNISSRTVKRYESGEIIPSMQVLKRISEALNIDYKELNMEEDKKEMVDHPRHYNMGKYEVIDVIEDWNLGFNLGNTVKYIGRAGHKDNVLQELKKARWYLDREIDRETKRLEKE